MLVTFHNPKGNQVAFYKILYEAFDIVKKCLKFLYCI